MKGESPNLAETKMADAMSFMQQALQLLDESQAPADIGAHLDLAIVRLGQAMTKASCALTERELSAPESKTGLRSTG